MQLVLAWKTQNTEGCLVLHSQINGAEKGGSISTHGFMVVKYERSTNVTTSAYCSCQMQIFVLATVRIVGNVLAESFWSKICIFGEISAHMTTAV